MLWSFDFWAIDWGDIGMGFDDFLLFLTLDIGFIVLSLDLRNGVVGVFPLFFASLWIAALSFSTYFFLHSATFVIGT